MESNVLEQVMNRLNQHSLPQLNEKTQIDGEIRISDVANGYKSVSDWRQKCKNFNEKKVCSLIYLTLRFDMRIDDGMCGMILDLLENDLKRFQELLQHVEGLIKREKEQMGLLCSQIDNKVS